MNKKKIFGYLFMGLLAVGATGTVTSCKDYDDDINKNTADIQSLKQALTQQKTDLEKEIASLKTQLEAKDAELTAAVTKAQGAADAAQGTADAAKKAAADEAVRAAAAEAALEARLATAESALEDINKVLANKVDQSEFDSTVKDIYAKIETVQTGLADALKKVDANTAAIGTNSDAIAANKSLIESLKQGLANEEIARKAVAADLEQQKTALANLQTKLNDLSTKFAGQLTELTTKINTLSDNITTLTNQINDAENGLASKASVAELTNVQQTLDNKINSVIADINALNVLLEQSLRSLVFIPQSYYWGVEATKLLYLDFNAISDQAWISDANMNYAVKEAKGYDNDTRYATAAGTKVLSFAATYHMNPSSAQLDPKTTKVSVESGDLDYINTRAAAAGISVKKNADGTQAWSVKDGILTVNLDVNDPAKIKSVKNDQMITNFATSVNVAKKNDKDTTITSDYATLYTEKVSGLKLALTNNTVNGHILDGAPKSKLSACTLTGGTDYGHLMQTVHEAGVTFDPQVWVAWNSEGIDLRKFVETHYTNIEGKNAKLDDATFNANFKYVFKLTAFYKGTNETDESAHAAIANDGYTLRPQAPDANGKQTQYGSEQNRAQEIGRTPVVRVTLVDQQTGKVYDYGYIRIKIVDPTTIPSVTPDKVVSYTGNNYSYNGECTPNAWSYATKWYITEQDLYKELGLTREEFEKNYTLDGDADDLNQYQIGTDGKATALKTKIGTASSITDKSTDPDGTKSSTLKWEMTSKQAYKFFVTEKKSGSNVAIRYISADKTVGPDVYVEFIAGTKLEGTLPSASLNLDAVKNSTIWSKKNGTAGSGKYEFDMNVNSPNDYAIKDNGDKPFEKTLAEAFVGNKLDATKIVTNLVDNTANKEYAASKLTLDLVFDASNAGKEFKGISGKTYVLSVADNGKTLNAAVKGTTATQAVVKITGTDVNAQKAVYQETAFAKDLLNYKAHNALDDNTLTAVIGVLANNGCHELTLTNNTFNVRFLRPLNITNTSADVEDAGDAAQEINLMKLMTFTDYRDLWQNGYEKFYGITGVKVVGVANGEKISTNADVMTNQNGKEQSLQDVNGAIDFVYHANGTLTYKNYNSTTADFWVKIPVVVTYDWGEVPQTITVNVKRTHSNAKRR